MQHYLKLNLELEAVMHLGLHTCSFSTGHPCSHECCGAPRSGKMPKVLCYEDVVFPPTSDKLRFHMELPWSLFIRSRFRFGPLLTRLSRFVKEAWGI